MFVQEESVMFASFFVLAARAPARQKTLRRLVVAHVALLTVGLWFLFRQSPRQPPVLLGHLLLVAGIVEGALLVGWRLAQLPKSQALEFLLVSPLRPARVFLAESLVGLTQLGLVTLSGLPVLAFLVADGRIDLLDPLPLLLVPFTFGALTGVGLVVWAYEPLSVRRIGERVLLLLILVYLIVGVLAGENLRNWIAFLPQTLETGLLAGLYRMHTHNPFGILRWWLENDFQAAWERMLGLEVVGLVLVVGLLFRGGSRLQGHFQELHYRPLRRDLKESRGTIGDWPLSWWAVRRVTRYSGRVNLWLAGGFGLLYALYVVAGPHWPSWMGRRVFQICDQVAGVGGLTTALVLLAAVPAAFQYGLWDPSTQDRCRRLELLLLTRLGGEDYWNAAASAAWNRGRGYFLVALVLWVAAGWSGRVPALHLLAAGASGVLLWALYFALGFRAFARGAQANGLGILLTVGLPLTAGVLTYLGSLLGGASLGALLPPGLVYHASSSAFSAGSGVLAFFVPFLGAMVTAGLMLGVARHSVHHCDRDLRSWYDRHHGDKVRG
jgi:hypothetical protein